MIYHKNDTSLSVLERKIIYQNASECPVKLLESVVDGEKGRESLDHQACLERMRFFLSGEPERAQALVNACYKVAKTNPKCLDSPPLNDGWGLGEYLMNLIGMTMNALVSTARAEAPLQRRIYREGEVFGADVKTAKIHEVLPPNQKFALVINNILGQVKPGTYTIIWDPKQGTYIFEGKPALGRVKIMPRDRVLQYRDPKPKDVSYPEIKEDPEEGFFRYTGKFPKEFDAKAVYPGLDIQRGFSIRDVPSKTGQKIVVSRASGKLYFFENDQLVHSFGSESGGGKGFDKIREGDKITPLGIFRVAVKNPNSKYQKALLFDYPTVEDAERGIRDGIITKPQYDSILSDHKSGTLPPQNTALGGYIAIHGNLNNSGMTGFLKNIGLDFWSDRRFGCVRLTDDNIKTLYTRVKPNSPILILP